MLPVTEGFFHVCECVCVCSCLLVASGRVLIPRSLQNILLLVVR